LVGGHAVIDTSAKNQVIWYVCSQPTGLAQPMEVISPDCSLRRG